MSHSIKSDPYSNPKSAIDWALHNWLTSDTDECFTVETITDADYPPVSPIIGAPQAYCDQSWLTAPEDIRYPACPHCSSGMVNPTDAYELTCSTCNTVYEVDEDDEETLTITERGTIKPFIISELGELL